MLNLIVLVQALFSVIKEGVVQNQHPPTSHRPQLHLPPTTDQARPTTDHLPIK